MRKEFSAWIEEFGRRESKLVFLTGDLGFGALETVQTVLGPRFLNMGVCEQNMMSVAAGLAHQGLIPLCYSIAPFAVFRPYEQIRLDVALHKLPVKIVGNGGGYGYGIMGASHHAIEDLAVLSCLPDLACIVPLCNSDVAGACEAIFLHSGPAYLRLGFGAWPDGAGELPAFAPIRRIAPTKRGVEPRVTVAGIGPVLLNALPWMTDRPDIDIFAVSRLPLPDLTEEFYDSIRRSQRLFVLEEHVRRGGLGEHLASALAARGIGYRLFHSCAAGYPDGLYGSQAYHRASSGLDPDSLRARLADILA